MSGPIIPDELWPEDAALHTWDGANGHGYWTVYDKDGEIWTVRASHIPMPAGHDWRVPVMRPSEQAPAIGLELVREAVEVAIAHAGPNDASLAGWQRLLALIDGQAEPPSDGIADTLRLLLTERGHRTDGNLQELADRCLHLARRDRELIALRGNILDKLHSSRGRVATDARKAEAEAKRAEAVRHD